MLQIVLWEDRFAILSFKYEGYTAFIVYIRVYRSSKVALGTVKLYYACLLRGHCLQQRNDPWTTKYKPILTLNKPSVSNPTAIVCPRTTSQGNLIHSIH